MISFVVVFAVSQGAKSLGLPSLTLGSVQAELDATTVEHRAGRLRVRQRWQLAVAAPLTAGHGHRAAAAVPVGGRQRAPGARVARRHRARRVHLHPAKSLAISLRHLRSVPFLFYCWTLTILYGVTFQAFANFGLLDRQRSLVLPALYVLLCLDWRGRA